VGQPFRAAVSRAEALPHMPEVTLKPSHKRHLAAAGAAGIVTVGGHVEQPFRAAVSRAEALLHMRDVALTLGFMCDSR
jgi:hypothetical protein